MQARSTYGEHASAQPLPKTTASNPTADAFRKIRADIARVLHAVQNHTIAFGRQSSSIWDINQCKHIVCTTHAADFFNMPSETEKILSSSKTAINLRISSDGIFASGIYNQTGIPPDCRKT